jgi:hypothetical protein
MTYEEAEELAALVSLWNGSAVTLTCAADVMHELEEVAQLDNGEPPEVQVIPHYEPGQWKLTRHDACDVIGGYTIEDAVIVSHRNCTVLRESG